MKHLKMAFLAILSFFCITTVNAQTKKDTTAKHQHTLAYQCPMKCEGYKTYEKAGKCPTCNMDLKAVAEKPAMGAMYQCNMKCEGNKTYDKAGKCPECNMNLKKVEVAKTNTQRKGQNHH